MADFSKPPSYYEEKAERAMKRRKWSEAARHFRDAAAVTAGHNRAARYIEAAERMERRVDGKPAPRVESTGPVMMDTRDFDLKRHRGRSPRENPTVKHVVGYIASTRSGTQLTSVKGTDLPWVLSEVVAEYRNGEGDKSAAVILAHARRRGLHAVGYLLVDGGSLFRGEQSGSLDFHDLRREARAEADYWSQLDADAETYGEEE